MKLAVGYVILQIAIVVVLLIVDPVALFGGIFGFMGIYALFVMFLKLIGEGKPQRRGTR